MLKYLFVVITLVMPLAGIGAPGTTTTGGGSPGEPGASVGTLFGGHELLELALAVDFNALCRPNEVKDCDYTPVTLRLQTGAGAEQAIGVQVRVRGGWRARKHHCDVPPLFVRFPVEGVTGTPFAGQTLLPLTTHCRAKVDRGLGAGGGADYEQYVLKEYIGYRLYNLVTDRSLRVRLVRINYSNPAGSGGAITRYAFFTEHFDAMAVRLGLQRLPRGSFAHDKVDLRAWDEVALFNFMIGNTDWSVVRQRNIVLLANGAGRQYPVPFDLDMSGLVDAEYAGVSPRLDFRDPKHRYYLGFCHPQPDFESLFSEFRREQQAMLALPADTPGLSRDTRKVSRRYLEWFFNILDSPQRSQQDIIGACHPWPPSPVDHTTPPDPA